MRTRTAATLTGLAVVCALLAACGPTKTPNAGGPPTGGPASAPASPAASQAASQAPAVKDVPAGNCTLYTKADAVKLLGGVNINNKSLDLATEGGTKIDQCSYLFAQSLKSLQGVTYAVVRYDSPETAFAKAKKLRSQMLDSAASNDWPVQTSKLPPASGQLLAGYGTKNDHGLTYTIAVVGTNVGPYLVAALGASTASVADAKKYAQTAFQSLSASVG